MKKAIAVVSILMPLFYMPVRANEQPGAVPDAQLPKYVVDHLDLASFPSSLSPRLQSNKSTFADYEFKLDHLDGSTAALQSKDENWLFEIRVLKHDKVSVTICLHDMAEHGGTYDTESILQLHLNSANDKLEASKDTWIAGSF